MTELDLGDELAEVSTEAVAFLVTAGAATALATVVGLIGATAGVV